MKRMTTRTSKMPGGSFSLRAIETCPAGAALAKIPGSVCEGCYARKGRYSMPNVSGAQRERRRILGDSPGDFVRRMVEEIRESGDRRFRVHDSGDLFSGWYARAWRDIARALPGVTFWIPTKEWGAGEPRISDILSLAREPNVVMRPSAPMVNDPPPEVGGLAAGTMVVPPGDEGWARSCGAMVCPSTLPSSRGGCEENGCFTCWDDPGKAVAYVRH